MPSLRFIFIISFFLVGKRKSMLTRCNFYKKCHIKTWKVKTLQKALYLNFFFFFLISTLTTVIFLANSS